MTKEEQRKFVIGLIDNIKRDILLAVKHMPDEWDGHELRAFIAHRFNQCAFTVGSKDKSYRKRTRAFRNDLLTRMGLD